MIKEIPRKNELLKMCSLAAWLGFMYGTPCL